MLLLKTDRMQSWRWVLLSIFIVSLSGLSHAQEVNPEEQKEKAKKQEEKGRSVKIIYYLAEKNAPKNVHIYSNEAKLADTALPRHNFSETFSIPADAQRIYFSPQIISKNEPLDKGAPTLVIPKTWKKVLLLVSKDPNNKVMPIKVKAIDASDNHFPPGSVYMINLSQIGLKGQLGDKQLTLKPRSYLILKNPIAQNGYYPVKLQAYIAGEAKPRRFIRQMWQRSDRVKNVLFIIPKPAPLNATYYTAPLRDF